MKIAVLGAGAMGLLYGGSLIHAGADLLFIDVVPQQIDAINQRGVTLTSDSLGTINVPAKAYRAQDLTADINLDLIILFTKSIHSQSALDSVKHLIQERTHILTLQNGIGHQDIIKEYVPLHQIILGMTGYPGDSLDYGVVVSQGSSYTSIYAADGKPSYFVDQLGELISAAGLNCRVSPETFVSIWEKVCFNAAANSLTTVTQLVNGDMANLGAREMAYKIAQEGITVANKLGIAADYSKVKAMLDNAFVDHYDHKPSMLQDFLAQKPTEIYFINGAIARQAEQLGLEAPRNELMSAIITTLENSYTKRVTQ